MTVVFLTRSMHGVPEVTALTLSLIRTHCDSTQSGIWIKYHTYKTTNCFITTWFLGFDMAWTQARSPQEPRQDGQVDAWMNGRVTPTSALQMLNVKWKSEKSVSEKQGPLGNSKIHLT